MNSKWKSLTFALSLAALALIVFPVAAQLGPADCGDLGIACPEEGGDANQTAEFIGDTLRDIINIALGLVSLIAGIFVVYGGFLYITSGGESERAAKGKKTILFAIVGLLIIGLSAVIVNFVISFFADGGGTPSGM